MDYYDIYDRLSDQRLERGVNKKISKFQGYDDMFTTTTYMTDGFKCFMPTDDEIRRAALAKGEPLDQILLDEYIDLLKELMVEKIRRATTRRTYYSKSVAAAIGDSYARTD